MTPHDVADLIAYSASVIGIGVLYALYLIHITREPPERPEDKRRGGCL